MYIPVIVLILTVRCSNGEVRIDGGDGKSYGHVEVCISGVWRQICSDTFWNNTDAGVVCKQLGFSQYGIYSSVINSMMFNCHTDSVWHLHVFDWSTLANVVDIHFLYVFICGTLRLFLFNI